MDILYWAWLAAAFFVVMWVAISISIGRISGWAPLARDYRLSVRFEGKRWRFQSAQMRWGMNYRNCLTLGANDQGLFLETLIPFRAGHPPLLIPWQEISIERKKYLWVRVAELHLDREIQIPFRIREGLADRPRDAAGRSWPVESVA